MAKKDEAWTDDTVMPWGKHEGERMEDVPAEYLTWLSCQDWINKFHGLKLYLDSCERALEMEIDEHRDDRGESSSFDDYLRNWKGQ